MTRPVEREWVHLHQCRTNDIELVVGELLQRFIFQVCERRKFPNTVLEIKVCIERRCSPLCVFVISFNVSMTTRVLDEHLLSLTQFLLLSIGYWIIFLTRSIYNQYLYESVVCLYGYRCSAHPVHVVCCKLRCSCFLLIERLPLP